ncbi:MAG: tetratricopeptide repeat protein [Candidatus Eremiobacterota bacterium]
MRPVPPEIPRDAPPQLRLRLILLTQALQRQELGEALELVRSTLTFLLRLSAGVVYEAVEAEGLKKRSEVQAMRQASRSLDVLETTVFEALRSLPNPPGTRRAEQALDLFFHAPNWLDARLHSCWLRVGGRPLELLRPSQWGKESSVEAPTVELREYLEVLADWLVGIGPLFTEDGWDLDRELELAIFPEQSPHVSKPTVEKADPTTLSTQRLDAEIAGWCRIALSPHRAGQAEALRRLMAAFVRRGTHYLWYNRFSRAEQDFDAVVRFSQGPNPLSHHLAEALTGRGRARTCLGRFEEADEDFQTALPLLRIRLETEVTPEGAVEMARALFFRALNLRCQNDPAEALEELQDCLMFCRFDPNQLELPAAALVEQSSNLAALERVSDGLASLRDAARRFRQRTEKETSTRWEVEYACVMVELAHLQDPTLESPESRADWKTAQSTFRRIRKREPSLGMGGELLGYLLERRHPWGRSEHDPLAWERDLRAARALLDVLPKGEELRGPLAGLLDAAQRRVKLRPWPNGLRAEFFGLFSDLAAGSAREATCGWQGRHWLVLADLFPARNDPDGQVQCLLLACCCIPPKGTLADAQALVASLCRLAELLPGRPDAGRLELLAPLFPALRVLKHNFSSHSGLQGEIGRMASLWRALPSTLRDRAGARAQLLDELCG